MKTVIFQTTVRILFYLFFFFWKPLTKRKKEERECKFYVFSLQWGKFSAVEDFYLWLLRYSYEHCTLECRKKIKKNVFFYSFIRCHCCTHALTACIRFCVCVFFSHCLNFRFQDCRKKRFWFGVKNKIFPLRVKI